MTYCRVGAGGRSVSPAPELDDLPRAARPRPLESARAVPTDPRGGPSTRTSVLPTADASRKQRRIEFADLSSGNMKQINR